MKIDALKDVVFEIPEAKTLVEYDGSTITITGFVVVQDKNGDAVVVFKTAQKTPVSRQAHKARG